MEKRVEGVMMDRKISRKLNGKVLDSCVVPASTALSETHQYKLLLLPILCRAAFYCRIIAHWRSGQEELVRS